MELDPLNSILSVINPEAITNSSAPGYSGIRMAASSSEEETRKKTSRKRKADHDRQGKKTPPLRTLKQYMIEEKLDIINFAKQMGNRAAGREYNVAESSIREWRKNEERLRTTLQAEPNRNRLVGGGRKPVERKRDDHEEPFQPEIIQVPLSLRLMGEESRDTLNSSGGSIGTSDLSTSPSPNASEEKKVLEKKTITPEPIHIQAPMISFPNFVPPIQPNLFQQLLNKNPNAILAAINQYPALFSSLQQVKIAERQAPLVQSPILPQSLGSSKRKRRAPQKVILEEENDDTLPLS